MTSRVSKPMIIPSSKPGPAHKRLDIFIGKWINEGEVVASANEPPTRILTSDVYEWMPGGFFVLHTAYGRIGDVGVGGVEIIGYDPATQQYFSRFFDSAGNVHEDELSVDGDRWTWRGKNTGCTAVFTENGKVQTAHHIRIDDQGNWVPSMEVVLTKVM